MGKRIYAGNYAPATKKNKTSYGRPKSRAVSNNRVNRSSGRGLYSKGRSMANSAYRMKKGSRRSFKKHLYESTKYAMHHRSVYSYAAGTISTPISNDEKQVVYRNFLPANFWLAAGGYNGTSTFSNGDLTIRGGIVRLALFNSSDVSLRVEVTKLFVKTATTDLTVVNGAQNSMWDLTLLNDYEKFCVMNGRKTILISPNERVQLMWKLPIQKIDQSTFLTGYRNHAFLMAVHAPVSAIKTLEYTYGHNLSFVGDAIA